MEIKNKEWFEILGKVADYHSDPLIMLDTSFEIIFTNQKAVSIFSIDDFNLTLEQVFEQETVIEFTDAIGIVLNSSLQKNIKNLLIKLKGGSNLIYDVSIELINLEDVINIVLLFRNVSSNKSDELIRKIKIPGTGTLNSNQSIQLESLLSDIQIHLPVTIVSSKNIQLLIDKYDFPIWIKNTESKLICLNNSYSSQLGIEVSNAKGKKHETFLPQHQKAIYNLLDQYIFTHKQQIVLEGFSKKVNNIDVFQSIVQVPLLDNLNKISVIVGLIVDNIYDYYNFWGIEDYFDGIFDNFPVSIALVDKSGLIKNCNDKFSLLCKSDKDDIVNKKIEELFLSKILDNFNFFIQSDSDKVSFYIDENFNISGSSKYLYKISLIKNKEFIKQPSNVLLILQEFKNEIIFEDELQNILTSRGKMFDILVQKNPDPIFIYDKENLKFLEANDAAIKMYGYSRDEFLQMDLTDLYAPEDIQTLLDSFGDESAEARFSKPFRHRKKDGTNVLVEISKTSFKFNEKEAHFNIIKDITASVEQEKQNQMLKAIFAESDLMVFTTDSAGFIIYANIRVTEKLGFSNDGIVQSSFASLVIDEDRAIVNTSVFQSHLKDSVVLETEFKTYKGNFIKSEITAYPILDFDGSIDSFTIVVKSLEVDSSVNKEPEEIVKEVIKEVVKEVVIEKIVTQEQRSIIPDSNFLSGMFHEILTPINVIIGFSQELITSTQNPTEEQLEASEIINQNRIKMMDTMNSVVEYSDIIQNKSPLKIESVSITEIIEKLDNNIQDISGINDIQFAYGKISSSLKFKTDIQKFENFILALIKVVSRLSKDKKVYFSSFAVDGESFLIGISDQYGNPSEYVSNVLEKIFGNDKDPKDFGLPKLTTYLCKILLSYLGGKFYRSSSSSVRNETGFIFPITYSPNQSKLDFKSGYESNDYTQQEKVVDNIFQSTKVEKFKLPEEPLEDFSEDVVDDITLSKTTSEEDDIFKPVPPIAQEILSKMTEENVESSENDENISQTDNSLIVEKNLENFVPSTPENEINLEEEIKEELNSEILSKSSIEEEIKPIQSLDLAKLNCLYIEDQIDSQILFKVQMKGLNEVKFAVSFEEAQLLLLSNQFDFIVMDINLQGEYNGLDALKIIKTMPAFSSIPIIAVTAYVLPGDKEKFIAAGFDDFISKPIFREKMMESLEKIFLS